MVAGFVLLARHRESIANDGLGDQSVRSGRKAVANAELDVELCDFKVGDREDLLRLFGQRQEIPDRSEAGVVLDADEAILAEVAREAIARRNPRIVELFGRIARRGRLSSASEAARPHPPLRVFVAQRFRRTSRGGGRIEQAKARRAGARHAGQAAAGERA